MVESLDSTDSIEPLPPYLLYDYFADDGVDLSSDSADERYLALTGHSPPRGFEAFRARVLSEDDDASSQSSSSHPSYPSPGDSDCE